MLVHYFLPLAQPSINGATSYCRLCGAENIENKVGCHDMESINIQKERDSSRTIKFLLADACRCKSLSEFLQKFDDCTISILPPLFYANYKGDRNIVASAGYAALTQESSSSRCSELDICQLNHFRRHMLVGSSEEIKMYKLILDARSLELYLSSKLFPEEGLIGLNRLLLVLSETLLKFRRFFYAYWTMDENEFSSIDERKLFQPLFNLFLTGILEEADSLVKSKDARNIGLSMNFRVPDRTESDSEVEVTLKGFADLMLFAADDSATAESCLSVIELKAPMQTLLGSSALASKDQLLGEVLCVADMKLSYAHSLAIAKISTDMTTTGTTDEISTTMAIAEDMTALALDDTVDETVYSAVNKATFGALTDMFSLNIMFQDATTKHCYMTPHVMEPRIFLLHLLLLCFPADQHLLDFLISSATEEGPADASEEALQDDLTYKTTKVGGSAEPNDNKPQTKTIRGLLTSRTTKSAVTGIYKANDSATKHRVIYFKRNDEDDEDDGDDDNEVSEADHRTIDLENSNPNKNFNLTSGKCEPTLETPFLTLADL